ncbi:ActS/PrrB/RegB family redox-sensitive histidine kinase [Coralliovum pocilloporae]|uniref:ActS/PrrB/RegB family redox-sensitive histidine kinase n=1 Tax=Coralliovum pocilloporae TaxID=3066369 RepID=UPI0033077027
MRPDHLSDSPTFERNRLKLDTLVRLRWLAVSGQSGAVLFVKFGLDFPMPLGPCFALIALSAWLNIFLRIRFPSTHRLRSRDAALLLAYDVCQLSGLLYLTGGLQNPFAVLLLVPVVVSATTLPRRWTVMLGILVLAVSTLLTRWHFALPWQEGSILILPNIYIAGVWIAIISSMAFMAMYTSRVAGEAQQLSDALSATELVLAHEQHLSALDGLATAAAHELGTPLATITLIAKELKSDLPSDDPIREDVDLIVEQSTRCRDILAKLRSLSSNQDTNFTQMSFRQLLEEVMEPHRNFGIDLSLDLSSANPDTPEPIILRNPGLLYGLGNIVENAVDFASGAVVINGSWTEETITLTVVDDGPGFSPELINRLGEPYVTSRTAKQTGGGLGLGFFIAKTLLERTGGRVLIANRKGPETGAVLTISWPRTQLDARSSAD